MTKLAFVDVETTGLDSKRHSLWEVGVIVREPDFEVELSERVRPSLDTADPASLKFSHYYDRAADWGNPLALARKLARLLNGTTLVGINVQFDRDFIAEFLRDNGEALVTDYHLIDVVTLAAGRLQSRIKAGLTPVPVKFPWRSDNIAKALGMYPEMYERHTALDDARFARDIYDRVMS